MKKRILLIWIALSVFCCSACAVTKDNEAEKNKLYEEAVTVLEQMKPDENGMYEVTEELVTALCNAPYTKPKNIIMMIGDGMGFPIIEAAQTVHSKELYRGTLAMNYLPVQSTQCTYSATAQTTDSAAGATALSTGYKTMNRTVGMNTKGKENYETVLELAAKKGKSTGVVVTKAVTDATPAAFTAHVVSRSMQVEIAGMQLDKLSDGTLDLALGGGYKYYEDRQNAQGLTSAVDAGVTYAKNWEEATAASLPVLGLFAENMIDTTDEAMPTVAEMTTYALEELSKDENGFFLMVEGSQIDTYGEKNEFERQVKELYDFDCAIAVAMRYVALHPDTVLIVTADHETGNLTIPSMPTAENIGDSFYTTGGHTYKTVPVLAAGYQTESLSGINENTDLAIFMAQLLGESEFGKKSTVYTVLDTAKGADARLIEKANPSTEEDDFVTRGKGSIQVSFDKADTELVIPVKIFTDTDEKIMNARALHMSVKNTTDSPMPLPQMQICLSGKEYSVDPQEDYIEPGQTMELSYIFPEQCWKDGALEKISKLVFTVQGLQSEIEFSNIQITDREVAK